MPNTDMSRQGMKRRKSKNNLQMDDDIDNNNNINVQYDHHSVDKASILREYMQKVHIRVFIIKFSLIILISLLYGITMSCVNITKSYSLSSQKQYIFNNNKISNIIYNIFLRSSSLSMLLLQRQFEYIVLLNTLLVIFLVLIVILLATFIIKQLQQMKKSYMQQVCRQQQYSLLIQLKHPINKSQIKGFIQYFQSVINMAVDNKVLQLNIIKQQQLTRQQSQQIQQLFQLNQHIHYLQSIVNKLTLVQDVVLLPQLQQKEKEKHLKHLKQQNYHQQNNYQQQQPIHNNNYNHHNIIAILSYPQLKQTLLQWFNIQKNRQKISTQIISIKQTPSPLDYMFGKYVGASNDENGNTQQQQSKRYITRTNGHKKLIVLGIVIQLLYIAILSTCTYFSQFPHHLLPSHIIQSFNQQYISYILLLIQSIVMFIYTKLYHQKFINEKLITSLPQCVRRSIQLRLKSTFSIMLLIGNLLIVPVMAQFVVLLVRYDWDVNNKMGLIIQNTIWGQQTSYGVLLICFVIIKWVIYQPMVYVIGKVKSNSCYRNRQQNINNNSNNFQQQPNQHLQYNSTIHHTIYESTIIFSLSIFINPFISLLPLINLIIITIKLFLQQTIKNNSNSYKFEYPQMCFVVFCQYHVFVIKTVLYLMICLGLLIGNGLLLVYGYQVQLVGQYYCVIVTLTMAVLLIVFVTVFIQKVNVPKCFSILPQFPIELFKPIKNHNDQNPQQYQPHHQNNNNININNPTHLPSTITFSHRKQKQTATLLINRIYTNQQFLFTYNQQMRKSAYFFKYNKNRVDNNNTFQLNNNNNNINKLNSTQKITEQLNTMSRSLQQTLKQRLMTNSTNPFQITRQHTKQDYQQQFDQPYQIKVNMRHSKPKTVRIPMLNLQQPKQQTIRQHNNAARIMRKTTIQGKDINKNVIKNNSQQHNNLKQKQPNQLKNRLFKRNQHKQKQQLDSDAQCDILSSIDKEDNQQRDKLDIQKNKNLQRELQNKKVKFTDLFDSDQESIKNIVKKKIKQSIPRITY